MKLHRRILLIILSFSLLTMKATGQWVQANGVYGGHVHCLVTKGTLVFAGTDHGIYRSTNNGSTWAIPEQGFPDVAVNAIAITDSFVYAGTDGYSILRSIDSGSSWSMANSGLDWTFVTELFASGRMVFAINHPVGLARSTDSGTTWATIGNTYPSTWFSNFAAIDTILLATAFDAFRSTDNGTSWIEAGFHSDFILVEGSTLFSLYSGAMSLSHDSGATWIHLPPPVFSIGAISAVVKLGTIFIACVDEGLYVSSDSGAYWDTKTAWMDIRAGLPPTTMQALAANDEYIFAAPSSGGVWRRSQSEVTAVKIASETLPTKFELEQNYPNPFNPFTIIHYTIAGAGNQKPGASNTRLAVYDVLGREVAVLVNEPKTPGSYEVRFDGSGLSSGVYVYRLSAGTIVQARTMVLMK